jgi:hypothetical protein
MKILLQCHTCVFIWLQIVGLHKRTYDKNRVTEAVEMHFFREFAGQRMTEYRLSRELGIAHIKHSTGMDNIW